MTQSFPASPESRRSNFDSGPLSWVMEEIREALNLSRVALFDAVAKGSGYGTTELNHANTYLHQAHGALQIIDVHGVTILTDSVEDILRRMISGEILTSHANARVIEQTYLALTEYLQELLSGDQQQPMRLFAYYKELQEIRGAERIHPADLFSPDLETLSENLLASEDWTKRESEISPDYAALRHRFEKSLLSVLTSTEAPVNQTAASTMRDIVAEIERAQDNRKMREFWRVMSGFTEMMSACQTPSSLFTKQVCGRMNRQIKLLAQGSNSVSERLLTDALYCLAEDDTPTSIASQVRKALQAEKIVPEEFEKKRYGQTDSVALGLAKSTLSQTKNAWNRATKGDAESASSFSALIKQLGDVSRRLNSSSLTKLLQAIESVSTHASLQNDKVDLEIATCLLFIENALDHLNRLPENFPQRTDALIERLNLVASGQEPPESAQWLDSLAQQTQQKQTVTLLASEMESSLRQVEKILDEYNVDQTKHAELDKIDPILRQIAGVLSVLGQDDAMQAVLHTQTLIRDFQASDKSADNDLPARSIPDAITQNITALGFFIEMLPQHPESARSRFVYDPEQGIFYANLLEKSASRLTAPRTADPAFDPILDDARKAPPPINTQVSSPPGDPVTSVTDEEIDAELLDIFMSEAEEVLDFVKHAVPNARNHRDDQNQLSTLRRSFHTLKGSGRMVGLTAFAEAAYSIEQVMNLWLSDARGGTPELFDLLDKAAEELGYWVDELKTSGKSSRTPIPLSKAADRVKMGEAFVFDDAVEDVLQQPQENQNAPQVNTPQTAHQNHKKDHNQDMLVSASEALSQQQLRGNVIEFPNTPAVSSGERDDTKRIGDLQISVPLFNIFVTEADDILRFLAQDFSEWKHEQSRAVSTRAIQAIHTLAGISATVGFSDLQEIAHALEIYLQTLECQPMALASAEFDVLQQCVEQMKQMQQQIAINELPSPAPKLLQQLRDLQQAAATPAATAPILMEAEAFESDPASYVLPDGDAPSPQRADEGADEDVNTEFRDDFDQDLLPVFLDEGRDLLPQIGQGLRSWLHAPADTGVVPEILRQLHTAKGSARMAGAMGLGQHLHMIESHIEDILHSGTATPPELEDLLARYDHSMQIFDYLQNPGKGEPPVFALYSNKFQTTAIKDAPAMSKSAAYPPTAMSTAVSGSALNAADNPQPAAPVARVRVRADVLDRLVNQAGEVSIARSKIENEVGSLRQSLTDLTDNLSRLRSQLREVEIQAESQIASKMSQSTDREFDPLEFDRYSRLQELTRMMTESVDDVASIQDSLTRTVAGATSDLENQAQLTRSLQQDLMQVRMVPFSSIAERLYQVTRQTAKEVAKSVNLDIRGTAVEVDRSVLERMAGPLEHLLRNAVVHGIESRADRKAAGKMETGELLIEIRQEGNEVVIQLSDDGQGLDLKRIRAKAIASGLIAEGREPSPSELEELIFQSGFTTADEITAVAGRGVGMDVVRSEATSLGGRISLSNSQGKGTIFTINLPLTLAVSSVVLLNAGESTYAVPSVLVEQVQQLRSGALASSYKEGGVRWMGALVPIYFLPDLLGDPQTAPTEQQYSPVLILKSGNDRIALQVDEIIGNREVVVKNIGPQLARMTGIVGATVLGSGNIVLILNPVPLAHRLSSKAPSAPQIIEPITPADEFAASETDETLNSPKTAGNPDIKNSDVDPAEHGARKKNIVMVVDDSLTVRRVTQRFLQREGYQVILAKDGVDALEKLQDVKPDVMLVDIEMPRMDGFDLIRNVRSDSRVSQTPIIMITSRTASKHRNYAMELGANEYYGKPFQETQLLESIEELVNNEKEEA